ncbi:MAG: hypothetical protein H0X72_05125, partial [Acidobacteria bacterium]|nr:hypothetical protein [Acidobacteriota bacterium]
ADTNADADTDANTNADTDADADTNTDADTDADAGWSYHFQRTGYCRQCDHCGRKCNARRHGFSSTSGRQDCSNPIGVS